MSSSEAKDWFELGFGFGGSISAGAYLAGAADFLVQALDEWYAAKARGEDVPVHDVQLKVLAGASGGGMTAALWGSLAHAAFPHIDDAISADPGTTGNRFFDAWVNRIDLKGLLDTRDKDKQKLISALDSTVLDEISAEVFTSKLNAKLRPYVAAQLHVMMTLANLRGVPYRIPMRGMQWDEAGGKDIGCDMAQFADYMHFVVSKEQILQAGKYWLNPAQPGDKTWVDFRRTALATGAFPFGLAPRVLERDGKDYGERLWPVPKEVMDQGGAFSYMHIEPAWPAKVAQSLRNKPYRFWAVDGGTFNNEPLELAREALAGAPGIRNPRDPVNAGRLLTLIDPFVGANDAEGNFQDPPSEEPGLLDVLKTIIGPLRGQASFKPAELALARDESVFSRFMVAPTREGVGKDRAIASGSLGGFGGFVDRSFRIHDFQLGRRNAQQFLRSHFAMDITDGQMNPRFKIDIHAARASRHAFTEGGRTYYPVIPLVGSAVNEVLLPAWPQLTPKQVRNLKPRVEYRVNYVLQQLGKDIKNMAKDKKINIPFWLLALLQINDKTIKGLVADSIMKQIRQGLADHNLINEGSPNDLVEK